MQQHATTCNNMQQKNDKIGSEGGPRRTKIYQNMTTSGVLPNRAIKYTVQQHATTMTKLALGEAPGEPI